MFEGLCTKPGQRAAKGFKMKGSLDTMCVCDLLVPGRNARVIKAETASNKATIQARMIYYRINREDTIETKHYMSSVCVWVCAYTTVGNVLQRNNGYDLHKQICTPTHFPDLFSTQITNTLL